MVRKTFGALASVPYTSYCCARIPKHAYLFIQAENPNSDSLISPQVSRRNNRQHPQIQQRRRNQLV